MGIKEYFSNDKVFSYDEFDGGFHISSDYIRWYITYNEEIMSEYRLRISANVSFDRWANSTVIEETFNNEEDLCKYLCDNETDIYFKLFTSLSKDYLSLEKQRGV